MHGTSRHGMAWHGSKRGSSAPHVIRPLRVTMASLSVYFGLKDAPSHLLVALPSALSSAPATAVVPPLVGLALGWSAAATGGEEFPARTTRHNTIQYDTKHTERDRSISRRSTVLRGGGEGSARAAGGQGFPEHTIRNTQSFRQIHVHQA